MRLSDDIKAKIQAEYDKWSTLQYGDKSVKERQALGQFFTPPSLSVKMLEKFSSLEGRILDPTVGCGGLLAAAVIAGADPKRCYGIELDPETVKLCRERLAKLGVPRWNIRQGDALVDESYEFDKSLEGKPLVYFKVEDLGLSQVKLVFETCFGEKPKRTVETVDFSAPDEVLKQKFEKYWKLFELTGERGCCYCSEKLVGRLKFFNVFFKKFLGKKLVIGKDRLVELH